MLQFCSMIWGKRPILLYGTTNGKEAMPLASFRSRNDYRPWWWTIEWDNGRVIARRIAHWGVGLDLYRLSALTLPETRRIRLYGGRIPAAFIGACRVYIQASDNETVRPGRSKKSLPIFYSRRYILVVRCLTVQPARPDTQSGDSAAAQS